MEFISVQKGLVTSPRKLRMVVPVVKKLTPKLALERMEFLDKRATKYLSKVVASAVANARQKGIDIEELNFKEIQINEGARLKRWRAGAKGRAKPYKRRMSHIRVVLETKSKIQTSNVQNKEEQKKEVVEAEVVSTPEVKESKKVEPKKEKVSLKERLQKTFKGKEKENTSKK